MFKNNKLEYVFAGTDRDRNIVKSMTISNNIYYLRYLYNESDKRKGITLDIAIEYSSKLYVFYV